MATAAEFLRISRAGFSYERMLFMRRPLGEPLRRLRLTAVNSADRDEIVVALATLFWCYLPATVRDIHSLSLGVLQTF